MAYGTVLHQVLIMFILMAAGCLIYKIGLLGEEAVHGIIRLLMLAVSPCVIFFSFQLEYSPSLLRGLLISAGSAVGVHLFAILLGLAVFRKRPAHRQMRAALQFSVIYANCGFMGIPLVAAVIGPKGIFYASVYIAVFNLFNWTHGITVYIRSADAPPPAGDHPALRRLLSILRNPNLIAVGAGLICFCLSIRLPAVLYDSFKYIYELNTPLAMLIIGCRMAQVNLRELFSDKWVLPGVFLRNLLVPAVAAALLHIAGVTGTLLLACLLPAACPVAGNAVLMADLCGIDTKFPARLMSVSTLFSVVTIPLIVYIVSLLGF